ncbi:BTB/POZ and MATH domain-containing protein 1 [Brachypodium distachyon]|uniref:BTB/POZ and MATH domain-containing protein 1 n=1 Tax=Brachypodium distachyon TaxID=15368 RepID=UPI000D0DBBC8|nr:BTB/POZ and MATH domain-containing protein 1 [Brachypodium distachyon]|eukprot:XP_024317147.1 BTB/POZ and MATH domain-containing protein 1 [Brachypodium distachyon]
MPSEISKTASRCTVERARGTHTFEIVGYEDIKTGDPVQSATLAVGGYDWALGFYRDGRKDYSGQCGLVFLRLMNNKAEVRGVYDLSWEIQTDVGEHFGESGASGRQTGEAKSESERWRSASPGVGIRGAARAGGRRRKIAGVGGETFSAHKIVLATRSPVFKAELYGQMKERTASRVTIQDMQPAVFKAFLHFIYTDSLPADMYDPDAADGDSEMIRHLLVAADRYAMDRLKLVCQSFLCEYYVDAETVATTLALADQHNCDKLKDACIEFIASSEDAVVATKGYASLKRTCPSLLIDALEKAHKFRKT